MKIKKILFYLFIVISIFLIYKATFNKSINYIALGDSVAEGVNPYGEKTYGYTDYIADYLDTNGILGTYIKDFAKSNYAIEDLYDDINNNKSIKTEDNYINLKSSLRESDLVTISIGLNDLKKGITISNIKNKLIDKNKVKNRINEVMNELDKLIKLIIKYGKGDIIVVGYYNPLPYLNTYKEDIDEIIDYTNKKYKEVCDNNKIYFVEVSKYLSGRTDYLPNPFDIHPNTMGYNEIFKQVKKVIDNKYLNN